MLIPINLLDVHKKIFQVSPSDDCTVIGSSNLSDGYHTFEELYEQRMYLFLVICKTFKNSAWKSKEHGDGTPMYKDYFIVGITTPEGDYSYHYHIKHWDLFDVKELPKSPPFDGHTAKDVTRLLSLKGGE